MSKILFDANFKDDNIGRQMNFRLFSACEKVKSEYIFEGIAQYSTEEKIPNNVNIFDCVNMFGLDNLWRASVPAITAFSKKTRLFQRF